MRNANEIGDGLETNKLTRKAAGAGTWVCGRLNGHRFAPPPTTRSNCGTGTAN